MDRKFFDSAGYEKIYGKKLERKANDDDSEGEEVDEWQMQAMLQSEI